MTKRRSKRLLTVGWRVPLVFALVALVAAFIVQSVERGLHEPATTTEAGRH